MAVVYGSLKIVAISAIVFKIIIKIQIYLAFSSIYFNLEKFRIKCHLDLPHHHI